jgi:hypothetical protein
MENEMKKLDNSVTIAPEAWWQVGMLWLVIGGPLFVVIASLITAVIAYRGADPVLDEYQSAARPATTVDSATPALRARNLGAVGH